MSPDVAELEERFQQLNRSRSSLSAEMRSAATALRTAGAIPGPEMDGLLDHYRELFGRFRAELEITSEVAARTNGTNWDLFQDRLHVCRQAAEATQRLKAVEQLRVPTGFEVTLDPVRQACGEVTARITKSPWDELELVDEVRQGRHPLCRLVSLVERLDLLTDDEWTTEMSVIQQMFGAQVSTAIARGKVTLSTGGQVS